MAGTERKAPTGLKRLTYFPLTADTASALTYGEAYPMSKAFMSADYQAATQTAGLYADNQEVDHVVVSTGGTLNNSVTQLNTEDHITILGAKAAPGGKGYVLNKDDAAPYLGVAYMTTNSDGTVNLLKFFKVKFSKGQTTNQSTGEGAPTFATNTLNGNYVPTLYDGNAMAEAKGLDPVTDAAFIESWFTEGDFIGETTGE